jgi:hypothetical protein
MGSVSHCNSTAAAVIKTFVMMQTEASEVLTKKDWFQDPTLAKGQLHKAQ